MCGICYLIAPESLGVRRCIAYRRGGAVPEVGEGDIGIVSGIFDKPDLGFLGICQSSCPAYSPRQIRDDHDIRRSPCQVPTIRREIYRDREDPVYIYVLGRDCSLLAQVGIILPVHLDWLVDRVP